MGDGISQMQVVLGLGATILGFACALPYYWGIYKHTVKPHLFSWLVWGLMMSTAAVAQIFKEGGAGAWYSIVGAAVCLSIAGLSLRYGTKDITASDRYALIGALAAIPLWIITNDPTLSVILITCIDCVGFYPTIRKSWRNPYQETILLYAGNGVAGCLSITALGSFSIATVLYPAAIAASNFVLGFVLFYRRRLVPHGR